MSDSTDPVSSTSFESSSADIIFDAQAINELKRNLGRILSRWISLWWLTRANSLLADHENNLRWFQKRGNQMKGIVVEQSNRVRQILEYLFA